MRHGANPAAISSLPRTGAIRRAPRHGSIYLDAMKVPWRVLEVVDDKVSLAAGGLRRTIAIARLADMELVRE